MKGKAFASNHVGAEKQRVAVVTGGAAGIGKCIAEEFRKQGVRVYVIDKAQGDHFVGDLSDKGVLEAFAGEVIRESGDVSVSLIVAKREHMLDEEQYYSGQA